jgi:hypothetical protein
MKYCSTILASPSHLRILYSTLPRANHTLHTKAARQSMPGMCQQTLAGTGQTEHQERCTQQAMPGVRGGKEMTPESVRCKGGASTLCKQTPQQRSARRQACCDDVRSGPHQTRPLPNSTSYVSSHPFDEHHWTGNIHCVRDAMCRCKRTDFNTRLARATEPCLVPISSQPSSSPLPTRHLQPSQRYAPLGKLWMGTTAQAMLYTPSARPRRSS